jgi:enamine deaminase RidA (YjgF/YER057c/UK114 family)
MNEIQLINPSKLYDPEPNGYSHIAVAPLAGARLLHLAGQGGENKNGELAPDFPTQLQQAMDNLCIALEAAGAKPTDVTRTLVLVVDHSEERLHQLGAAFDRVWGAARKPACTLVPVPRLALDGMLFEIEATAVVY